MVSHRRRRRILRFFLGFACVGLGAMLAVPGPVGGVVAGWTAGAERDAVVEDGVPVLSAELELSDGVTTGAGLGTDVSPGCLLSA